MREQRDPLKQIMLVQEAIDQFIRDALARRALPEPPRTARVYETEDGDAFVIEVPLGGLGPGDVTVSATSDTLTVSVRAPHISEQTGRTYHPQEEPGLLSRVINFPTEVDTDAIQATVEHGFLRIQAPKAAIVRPRTIKIQESG